MIYLAFAFLSLTAVKKIAFTEKRNAYREYKYEHKEEEKTTFKDFKKELKNGK
jgi:hypothetical protein